MAFGPNELFTSNTVAAKLRIFSTSTQPKTFAVGAITLALGTPVAFDIVAKTWKVWADAGADETNIIRGFIWPDAVKLDAADEVLGNVILRGRVHRDDVPIPAGENQSDLDDAMSAGLRDRGIIMEGLEDFH